MKALSILCSIAITQAKFFAIGLICWILIIVLRGICMVMDKNFEYLFDFCNKEIIADGNNLFLTAVVYAFFSGLAVHLTIPIVQYIIIGILILFCIPSVISCILFVPQIIRGTFYFITLLAHLLNTFCPLFIAFHALFHYIL